jgi:hypothetical protein
MSAPVEAPPPEVLFAKHRLLPELGPTGQRALCAARFRADRGDATLDEATEHLVRSGLTLAPDAAPLAAPVRPPPDDPALGPAAAALAGALLATEKVREIVGVEGRPLGWPAELFESSRAGGS